MSGDQNALPPEQEKASNAQDMPGVGMLFKASIWQVHKCPL